MDVQPPNELLDATITLTMRARKSNLGSERERLNFAKAVTEAFAFLDSHGFSQVEASPTIVRYRKGDLEVDVYHGRQSYEIGFGIARRGVRYSIGELIRAIDSKAEGRNTAATTEKVLTEGLAQLARLAKQYGDRAFQGDPEFFAALDRQRKTWAREYALDVLEYQLRPKAHEAFRQGDYRKAAELYERILPRLTPVELKKLAFAKERGHE